MMKPSEMKVENLREQPELPKGWVWTRLGEVCGEVEKTYPKVNPNDEFLYLDIASIDNQQQRIIQPKRYRGRDAPSRARQLVHSGDILFSTVRTYLKNIAMVNEVYDGQIASTGFCVIRPSYGVNNRFIFSLTQADEFLNPLTQLQRGTSYPAVRDSDVFDRFIPLPPLAEQQRIVAKIEELFTDLDAGVEALQKVKAQLKRYRQAVLKHAFDGKLTEEWREAHRGELEPASVLLERIREERAKNLNVGARAPRPYTMDTSSLPQLPEGWVWTRFNVVCDKIQDGSHFSPKTQFGKFGSDRYLYISAKNIKEDGLDLSDVTYVDSTFHRSIYRRCDPKPGDVLLIKDGVKTGTATINNLEQEFSLLSSVAILRCNKEALSPYYLRYFLNSPAGFRIITGAMTGTAIKRIILDKVRMSYLPVPSFAEQLEIVKEIERRLSISDQVSKAVEQSLKQAERLRQSILKRAFEGKLVPQNPNDEPAEKLLERIKQAKSENIGAQRAVPLRRKR